MVSKDFADFQKLRPQGLIDKFLGHFRLNGGVSLATKAIWPEFVASQQCEKDTSRPRVGESEFVLNRRLGNFRQIHFGAKSLARVGRCGLFAGRRRPGIQSVDSEQFLKELLIIIHDREDYSQRVSKRCAPVTCFVVTPSWTVILAPLYSDAQPTVPDLCIA